MRHSQHLRKLVTFYFYNTTVQHHRLCSYSPLFTRDHSRLEVSLVAQAARSMSPPPATSDRQGRTLVLAFDGSNNQFNENVSRISPTATTRTLNLFHDPASSNPWIEHKCRQILFCSGSPILLATTHGPEICSPLAQKLDDPEKQMVFYQVRWLQ